MVKILLTSFLVILSFWSLDVLAKKQAKGPKPIEAAVLHIDAGHKFALPILSLPAVKYKYAPEGAMEYSSFESFIPDLNQYCPSKKCPPRYIFSSKNLFMRKIPNKWFDSTGKSYPVLGKRSLSAMSVSGSGLDLGPLSKNETDPNTQWSLSGRVLLSNQSGLTKFHPINDNVWKRWPELATELKRWKSSHIKKCKQDKICKQKAIKLTRISSLKGKAIQYNLPRGRKLQILMAASPLSTPNARINYDKDPDTYKVRTTLWRFVSRTGKTRILRLKQDELFVNVLSGTGDYIFHCESQCSGGWVKIPEIFFVHGRTFAVGRFSIGTTHGYFLLEILPNKLIFIGRYRGGS